MNTGRAQELPGWRALVASVCVLSLLLLVSAVGLQRGLVTGNHVVGVMLAADNGDPAPDTWGAACPNSVVTKPGLTETAPLRCPARAETPIRLRLVDDATPPARISGTPFRPPRTA
ncbi:hypothetical protein [Terrihabitans rhizophilus]|uniref:Uncharacterized protein n=1 Tax=Terrihabitans rhizophilus TaxID=3092662 RepID=A0ABU4RRJ7_9HYPH|nr:hypothetical protein [Terrihabitans sp. PJ23]MDX6806709.1 hypothetical protein [Terrihabitans sp. PJ23]